MHEIFAQILSQLRAAWRYRWYAIIVAWCVAIAGWIAVSLIPNRYEASARVYVDTQSVLRPLLQGIAVQPNVSQIVTMMSKTLISRPNLEKVIQMSDMDIKLKTPEDREQMIAHLSKFLTIKSAGAENLYTIALEDNDPELARRIVQSLLTIFVEGSLGNKRTDSDTAQKFIDEQLKTLEEKLLVAENAVTAFKRKNLEVMGEGQTYAVRLREAQAAASQASLELKEAENGRDAIKQQLAGVNMAPPSLIDESNVADLGNPELDVRIQDIQKKLDGLRLTYTEQHPDIVSSNRMIAQLKEQKEREAKLRKPRPRAPAQTQNPLFQQLSVAMAEAEANVASMKARVAEYERRYSVLLASANSVPQAEAEYTQLTRDYQVNKKNYEDMLARRSQAKISGDMEANASVMAFRIVDPPQFPSAPSSPNRLRLSFVVLLAALACGAGIAFLLSKSGLRLVMSSGCEKLLGCPFMVRLAWSGVKRSLQSEKSAYLRSGFHSLVC